MKYIFFEGADFLVYYEDDTGKWYVKNKANMISYDLSHKENMSSLLRVFIEDPVMVLETAKSNIVNLEIFDKLRLLFPLKDIIAFCLKNKMFYWLELALKWLPYFEIDDEFRTLINDTFKDKHVPQNIRHSLIQYR